MNLNLQSAALHTIRLFCVFLLMVPLSTHIAYASGLQVTPILITLPAEQRASGLTITNTNSTPITVQIRSFHWTQQAGQDVLTPATEIVTSPAMVTLTPGDAQLIRIIRLGAPPDAEQAYRVIVNELPTNSGAPSSISSTSGGSRGGLKFLLAYSIPVFLSPRDYTGEAVLHWSITQTGGETLLNVKNTGSRYAQLAGLTLRLPTGANHILNSGLAGYALAGKTLTWRIPAQFNHPGTVVISRLNGQPREDALSPSP